MFPLLPLLALMAVPSPAPELTVMSYNIRYGSADDGDNAWPNRCDRLAEVIREFAPDVFGLQECLDFQATFVADALPDYHWFGMGREADGSGEMAAVFYRASALAPVAAGHFWLSETPDTPGSKGWDASNVRIATWVRFMHRASGMQFYVFNTHLDHRGELAREASGTLLSQRIREITHDLPVMIMGDFNAVAVQAAPWKTLTADGFQDAWLTAEERAGATQTYTGFGLPEEGADARIDWILYRGPWRCVRCEAFVDHSRDGVQASDHLPIIVHLVPDSSTP